MNQPGSSGTKMVAKNKNVPVSKEEYQTRFQNKNHGAF